MESTGSMRRNDRRSRWALGWTLVAIATGSLVISTAAGATACNNTCQSYPASWVQACPAGERCVAFKNSCTAPVVLSYQIGCDANGQPGAPTCNCTTGPKIAPGDTLYWKIVDVDDSSTCVPKISPTCLTSGLAVVVNYTSDGATCTKGTRVELTAGNKANPYGKFDSYNIDVEKQWFGIPIRFEPDLACAHDSGLDCRPLWCGKADCPDAYSTPTAGGCPDGRSPQAACQDTFGDFGTPAGFSVEYCPAGCTATRCPSCLKSKACPASKSVEEAKPDSANP